MTNIALGFPCALFVTSLSSQDVYFKQTDGSTLSNTYIHIYTYTVVMFSSTQYIAMSDIFCRVERERIECMSSILISLKYWLLKVKILIAI